MSVWIKNTARVQSKQKGWWFSVEQRRQRQNVNSAGTASHGHHFRELLMDRESASHTEIHTRTRNPSFTSLTVQAELPLQTDTQEKSSLQKANKSSLQKQTRARATRGLTWIMTTGLSFKMGSFSKSWAKVSVPSPPKPLANAVMAGKTASGRSSHFTKPSMNSVLKEL